MDLNVGKEVAALWRMKRWCNNRHPKAIQLLTRRTKLSNVPRWRDWRKWSFLVCLNTCPSSGARQSLFNMCVRPCLFFVWGPSPSIIRQVLLPSRLFCLSIQGKFITDGSRKE